MGFAIVLMKSDEKYYVVVDDDNSIGTYKTAGEALGSFEDLYERNHARSFEGSMSACINWMSFQPAVVWFEDVEGIRRALFSGIRDEDIRVHSVRNVSGGFRGLLCGPGVESIWTEAPKPALISR